MENQQVVEPNSSMHIIAYITFIGLIIAFVSNNGQNKNDLTSYHIRQSLGIGIISLSLSVVGMIPVIGWVASILGFFLVLYMWVMGLMNAINHRMQPVPLFGKKFNEIFKSI